MVRLSKELTVKEIHPSEYLEVFGKQWELLENNFWKLECRQMYNESTDPSYEAYLKGKTKKAISLFQERIKSEDKYLKHIPQKDLDYTRIRIVEPTITDYTAYELETYRVSATYGQRILMLNTEKARSLSLCRHGDIMLFDTNAFILLVYDSEGRLEKRLLGTVRSECLAIQNCMHKAIKQSQTLGSYLEDKEV